MERQFASTELYALENEALAIENAIETLKTRLRNAPGGVANDVLERCDPARHGDLIDWIQLECVPANGRLPRDWSPKRNTGVWLLYHAANLACPVDPPRK
ncbi:MAG: hypothetical protein AAF230_01455 [Pseudomonadota bacterium]